MSIIVKGMEMPELYETYKVNFAMTNDGKIVMGMCPLNETGYRPVGEVVALPDKHGDLIDREEAYDCISEQEGGNYVDMDTVGKGLECTPVIVEAEESE